MEIWQYCFFIKQLLFVLFCKKLPVLMPILVCLCCLSLMNLLVIFILCPSFLMLLSILLRFVDVLGWLRRGLGCLYLLWIWWRVSCFVIRRYHSLCFNIARVDIVLWGWYGWSWTFRNFFLVVLIGCILHFRLILYSLTLNFDRGSWLLGVHRCNEYKNE